jgi:hypothetical protein
MGLSKPPSVELSPSDVRLNCLGSEPVSGQITLRTEAKKWVYARVESDAPWLRVTTPNVSGPQQAVILFEVNPQNLPPDPVDEGLLKIVANAGQALTARVAVDVMQPAIVRRPGDQSSRRSKLRTPAQDGAVSKDGTAPPGPSTEPIVCTANPILVGALAGLVFRLLLALPADLYARVLASGASGRVPAGTFASWLASPVSNVTFVRQFVLATWWLGAMLGFLVMWRRSERKTDLVFGSIAGGVLGLAGTATFACLLPGLDLLPRFLWRTMALQAGWTDHTGTAWLWTPVWIAFAITVWTLMGAAVGILLRCLGRPGAQLLNGLEELLASFFRVCGLATRRWAK